MIDMCLLGCGGSMPVPERNLSSVLMRIQGHKILVDCGEGTQVSMKMVGWGFKDIDVICITHGHGDHTIGLPGLLATIGNSGRTEPLIIIGPEGIKRIVTGLMVVAEYLPYEVKVLEAPEYFEINIPRGGTLEVNTMNLEHSAPCLGYNFYYKRKPRFDAVKAEMNKVPRCIWSRLQKEDRVVYESREYVSEMVLGESRKGIKISIVTDTRPVLGIADFIKDSGLFICEGTYGPDSYGEKAVKYKHMTFSEAAQLAKDGGVKKMILTHFSPSMGNPEEYSNFATDIFPNTIIGTDRMIENISFEE